jgi:ubiquinol oxidase
MLAKAPHMLFRTTTAFLSNAFFRASPLNLTSPRVEPRQNFVTNRNIHADLGTKSILIPNSSLWRSLRKGRVGFTRTIAVSFGLMVHHRNYYNFPPFQNAEPSSQQSQKPVAKPESPIFHNTSTRYMYTTPELLKALDVDMSHAPHKEPYSLSDKAAWKIVRALRVLSDWYFKDNYLLRATMLETIAAVPGLVAGMFHHLRSLRKMQVDNWIKVLLDEAENERMHLMTFICIKKVSVWERLVILLTQGVFLYAYLFFYLFFPKTAHRFVGYLEEEAVKTYNHFLEYIDKGKIKNVPAPRIAKDYWGLPDNATLRDIVLVIRADEMDHRDVNHAMSDRIGQFRQRKFEYGELDIRYEDLYGMDHVISMDPKSGPNPPRTEELIQRGKEQRDKEAEAKK